MPNGSNKNLSTKNLFKLDGLYQLARPCLEKIFTEEKANLVFDGVFEKQIHPLDVNKLIGLRENFLAATQEWLDYTLTGDIKLDLSGFSGIVTQKPDKNERQLMYDFFNIGLNLADHFVFCAAISQNNNHEQSVYKDEEIVSWFPETKNNKKTRNNFIKNKSMNLASIYAYKKQMEMG